MKTSMQTVIDYLQEMLNDDFDSKTKYIQEFCEQALETEKHQIIDARIDGVAKSLTLKIDAVDRKPSEDYYTSTFETNKETLK